jgi:hypothetical protein
VTPGTRPARLCPQGNPLRGSCIVHVHARTALTEPVRHRDRQQPGSGVWAGQSAVTRPGEGLVLVRPLGERKDAPAFDALRSRRGLFKSAEAEVFVLATRRPLPRRG